MAKGSAKATPMRNSYSSEMTDKLTGAATENPSAKALNKAKALRIRGFMFPSGRNVKKPNALRYAAT
jgi:hypothetical protein